MRGRPKEGRVHMSIRVLPVIKKRIQKLAKQHGSDGKAVESRFQEESK